MNSISHTGDVFHLRQGNGVSPKTTDIRLFTHNFDYIIIRVLCVVHCKRTTLDQTRHGPIGSARLFVIGGKKGAT